MSGDIDFSSSKAIFNTIVEISATTKELWITNSYGSGSSIFLEANGLTVYGNSTGVTTNEFTFDTTQMHLLFNRYTDGFYGKLDHEVLTSTAEWTLPNATGILALQTDLDGSGGVLSDYLPLAGGTLTGPLLNTSAILHGAASLGIPLGRHRINLTSSGATANTLADGVLGQRLLIVHTSGGGTPTITPTTLLGYSTITMNSTGDSVELEFGVNGWAIVSVFNAVIA